MRERAPRTELQVLAGEQNFFLGSMGRYKGGLIELYKRNLAFSNFATAKRLSNQITELGQIIEAYKVQFECDRDSLRVDLLSKEVGEFPDLEIQSKWLTAAYEYNKKYHTPGTISGLSSTKKKVV